MGGYILWGAIMGNTQKITDFVDVTMEILSWFKHDFAVLQNSDRSLPFVPSKLSGCTLFAPSQPTHVPYFYIKIYSQTKRR